VIRARAGLVRARTALINTARIFQRQQEGQRRFRKSCSDLRCWGLKVAERGGKDGKKRAVIATARKLAVLLHRLWVGGEAPNR